MVMYVDSKKVEKRLIEQGQRTQLAKEYPTCLYAGVELRLRIVFNEEVEQDWDYQAQEYIDIYKQQGRKASFIYYIIKIYYV